MGCGNSSRAKGARDQQKLPSASFRVGKRGESPSKEKAKKKMDSVPLQLHFCFAFLSPSKLFSLYSCWGLPITLFPLRSIYQKLRALGLENGLCDTIKFFNPFSINSVCRVPDLQGRECPYHLPREQQHLFDSSPGSSASDSFSV